MVSQVPRGKKGEEHQQLILASNEIGIRHFGLTPNRYSGLGWSIVTLVMLASITIRLVQVRSEEWALALRESIARTSILAVVWRLCLLVIMTLLFD